MKRKDVTLEALHRAALRSTRASAALENRSVPVGVTRSERVERFLAARLTGIEPGYGKTPVDPEEADALTPQAREIFGDAPKKIDLYEAEQAVNDEVSIAFLEQRACSPTWCSSPRKTRRRSQRPYDWDIDKRRYIALLRE